MRFTGVALASTGSTVAIVAIAMVNVFLMKDGRSLEGEVQAFR